MSSLFRKKDRKYLPIHKWLEKVLLKSPHLLLDQVEINKKIKNFNNNISDVKLICTLDFAPSKNKLCLMATTEFL